MKHWLFVVALLCGNALQAQELVDYSALFRDHADKVVVSPDGTETLNLPEGILVTRQEGHILAMDQSGEGAVQCTLSILGELRAVARSCPHVGQEHLAGLEQNFLQVLRFAAENAYPQQDVDALVARYEQTLAQPVDALNCARIAQDPEILGMMAVLANPNVGQEATKTPRLPVMNPCL